MNMVAIGQWVRIVENLSDYLIKGSYYFYKIKTCRYIGRLPDFGNGKLPADLAGSLQKLDS